MEVRKGYKQTEIGIFPNDWEIKKIGDVAELFGRIGFRGYTVNDIVKEGYGAITISPSNMQNETINFKKCTYISWFKYEESPEIKIYNGDILLVKTGSTFGKSALVENLNEKATINPQIVVFKKLKINNILLSKIISNPIVQEQINSSIVGGAIPTLSQRLVLNFKIPLPPTLQEQNAIANALSDTDTWINSLEQLLAKKRQIKQGAMQELLQPKEGWEVKKLGKICEIKKGKGISKSQLNIDGKYRCILYGELFTTYKEVIKNVISRTNFSESISSKKEDILFPGSTTTTGIDLAKASTILESGVLLGGDILIVRKINYDYNSIFLTYFLNVIKKNEIAQNTKGITIHHLYGSDLADLQVQFPEIEEQTRIAAILSDMDDEIAQLETKLAKAKQIKQGMMQELLTGRIRLV